MGSTANTTRIYNILKENGISELRPPQKKVIDKGLLDKKKNFLVCIPTASGKTVIGEMAFINHLLDENKAPTGKKCIFIVPLKALASEKYEEFKEKYEKYGLKVALSIGDFDEKEELSGYDLIITTAEKLDSLIRHNIKWINDVSLVIVDEIHLIGDEGRGGTLEILLTKLKNKYNIQIIGLSATIGNPEEFSEWLDAELVMDEWRPVELRKGIFYENKIIYIDNNDDNNMTKAPFKKINNISNNGILNLVIDSVLEGGSCLIFCNSKRGAVNEAKKLKLKKYLLKFAINNSNRYTNKELNKELNNDLKNNSNCNLNNHSIKYLDEDELQRISDEILSVLDQPTEVCKTLAECIRNGVAFHHAGLTYEQRKIVEDAFRKRIIKAICCTPTLSVGINAPCRRAIVKDLMRFSGRGMTPIPKMEIHQCIGRAGRPNLDPYGEGIIYVSNSNIDTAKNYLIGNVEEIYSKLSNQKVLRTHILGLITTGEIKNRGDLENFIKNTFYAHQYKNTYKILENIGEIVDFLERNKFIICSDDSNKNNGNNNNNVKINMLVLDNNSLAVKSKNRFSESISYFITPLGRRVSELYIDPLSAEIIIEGLNCINNMKLKKSNSEYNYKYIIHMLYLISKTTEMQPPIRVRKLEEDSLIYEMMSLGMDDISSENLAYFKNAKMLYDWINEIPEDTILKKYNIEPGILRYKVEQSKWVLHSAKEIFNLADIENKSIEELLNNLEIRLEYGAKQDIIELLKIRHVGRVRARMLYNSNIRSINDMISNPKKVASIVGEKIAKKIFDELNIRYGQQTLFDT